MQKRIRRNSKIQKPFTTGKTKWIPFEDVFKDISKTKKFQEAYNVELLRLQLAQQIREKRKEKKLTQKIVAERAKTTQSVIARLEKGDHGVSLDTLGRIVHAVGGTITIT